LAAERRAPRARVLVLPRGAGRPARAAPLRRPPHRRLSPVSESLARHALFADLSPEALAEFAAVSREETYPEGEWVIRQGDENAALRLILDGEAGFVVG